jgi:hypothetical protein
MPSTALRTDSRPVERRRHQRVGVSLLGRYMLESRREYPCQTVDISPGGLSLHAPAAGAVGERVICYLDQIGRVEGIIVRHLPHGFAMNINATLRKRDKLAAQLTWLANRDSLGLPEDRRHERVVPRNPRTMLTLDDGRQILCRMLDVSQSGVGVATDLRLPVGARVVVGRTAARVVRMFDGGLGLEFHRILGDAEIDTDVSV